MNILIVIAVFTAMEGATWCIHKYVMHGFLWVLHKDHHDHSNEGPMEKNDYFFVIFALPAIALMYFGSLHSFNYLFYIGLGITFYGISYFLVHDIFIHQRLHFFRNTNTPYFQAIRRGHKQHHRHLGKEDGECFGFLYVPMKYFRMYFKNKKMMPYTYILINFFTVIVCFAFSFHPKIKFYKQFPAFLKASILVAIPFILWDIWFTKTGIWWFNTDYTLGLTILGLPIEEWLFFICIPFACVFTYFCLDKFFKLNWTNAFNNTIVFVSIIVLVLAALLFYDKTYIFVTAIATTLTLVFLHFIVRATWIGKASFVYLILMLGFFPVNGVLTGTGLESAIVNYNPDEFLGIRMLTIPIEDAVYGYTQFLLVLYFFKRFQNHKNQTK